MDAKENYKPGGKEGEARRGKEPVFISASEISQMPPEKREYSAN